MELVDSQVAQMRKGCEGYRTGGLSPKKDRKLAGGRSSCPFLRSTSRKEYWQDGKEEEREREIG
jgi:hypothetical protein